MEYNFMSVWMEVIAFFLIVFFLRFCLCFIAYCFVLVG
jgi:hypothetical protein